MNIRRVWIPLVLIAVPAAPVLAQEKGPTSPKQFVVENVVNDQSTFKIKVTADRTDGVYHEQESLTFSILAERDCYVYLLNVRPDGEITCLFPNEVQTDNMIKGASHVQVPPAAAGYAIRARAPFGDEIIQVIASLKPIDAFPGKGLSKKKITELKYRDLRMAINRFKGFDVEVDPTPDPGPNREFWAEGKFSLKTVAGARPNQQP